MKYLIEHLEPEMWEWCVLEYKHMAQRVGKEKLVFCNVKEAWQEKIKDCGEVRAESVKLLAQFNRLGRVCLLDPAAEQRLEPSDKEKFDTLVFGGILGDNPPQERTRKHFGPELKWEKRNLGKPQMSTDTAIIVADKIMQGIPLGELQFIDMLVIPVSEGEEIILPYRYLKEKGKAVLPEGYAEFVKKTGM